MYEDGRYESVLVGILCSGTKFSTPVGSLGFGRDSQVLLYFWVFFNRVGGERSEGSDSCGGDK